MAELTWCTDKLRGEVPTKLNTGKARLNEAQNLINSAISAAPSTFNTGILSAVLGNINAIIESVNEAKNWSEEKANAIEDAEKLNKEETGNLQPKNNTDIAHRGYTPGGIYDNSAEGFRLAGEKGFWGAEADIRFGTNGNLVCSHNAVRENQKTTSFEEYLEICKEYGMTAIIDLKYAGGSGHPDQNLSPAVLKVIQEKGMMDSCILQTNNHHDVPYIRENSQDARIWYLIDELDPDTMNLIIENDVECVNIRTSTNNAYRVNKLAKEGIDTCVWGVETEDGKGLILNMGAKYVMSDNLLGITPYQEGEKDVNNLKNNSNLGNTPREPAKPTTPTKPLNPAKPTQPTTPTKPLNPAKPTQPTTPTKPLNPAKPTQPTTPTKPLNPTKPTQPTTPTKPLNPAKPTQPTTPTNPVTNHSPVLGTPEAILKAAKDTTNVTSNSEYICKILYSSGYFTDVEMNEFSSYKISDLCEKFNQQGWEEITKVQNLKVGDIIIVDNGEEKDIRIYAGNNTWYTRESNALQNGTDDWWKNTAFVAYRPAK